VPRLITIASPLGGDPKAQDAARAPVVLPSWRDINPAGEFIAGLHRKSLPEETKYHLLFAYGNVNRIKLGSNSDGVIPLSSQLVPAAQNEAAALYGFNDTHEGILDNRDAVQKIIGIIGEVHAPYPEVQMREMLKGGYRVKLGANYSPREAFYIHTQAFFLEALVSNAFAPVNQTQEHFIRAVRGETPPRGEMEAGWIKFVREYPDRQVFKKP
jgi:hypothetical protein